MVDVEQELHWLHTVETFYSNQNHSIQGRNVVSTYLPKFCYLWHFLNQFGAIFMGKRCVAPCG